MYGEHIGLSIRRFSTSPVHNIQEKSMIITLCGSARFEKWFVDWNEILTIAGHTVFSLTVFPSQKAGNKNWYTPEEKIELDKAHFRKIDASDAVFFINPWAYMGESTFKEWMYSIEKAKQMYALESWGRGKGVTENFKEEYREKAKKYLNKDSCDRTVFPASPVDTWRVLDPWRPSLLGDANTPARLKAIELYGSK